MSNTASTITIIVTVCGVTIATTLGAVKLLGDSLRDAIGEVRNEMRVGLSDLRAELRGVREDVTNLERTIVREHGERITRLEERL